MNSALKFVDATLPGATRSRLSEPTPRAEIDLVDLLGKLWSGKWTIVINVLVCLSVTSVWLLGTPPAYQADALLQLERRAGSLALPPGMQELLASGSSAAPPGEAEVAILRSRLVLRRAALESGLDLSAVPKTLPLLRSLPNRLALPDPEIDVLAPFSWRNESIRLSQFDLPERLHDTPFLLVLTGPATFRVTAPDGTKLNGIAGQRLEDPGLGLILLIEHLEGPIGREFILQRKSANQTTELALAAFSATEVPRNSSLFRLSYTAETPDRAEQILDAIIRAYLDQNIQSSAAKAQNSLDFIEKQLPLAEMELQHAQEALNDYRLSQNTVDVSYETRNLLEQATSIEAELNALALEEEELKKRYTPNHPTYQSLLETRTALQARLERVKAAAANVPQTQRDIINFTRNLEVAQQVYVQLLNRAQELRVVKASTVGTARIVDPAWSSGRDINIDLGRGVMLAIAFGLILGSLMVLLRPLLHRGISGADQIERLGLPVFASIHHSPFDRPKPRRGPTEILALKHPDALATEAFRALRTALHFRMLGAQSRSILLTSAAPESGKSFTAINLAVIAAEAGQKVCLIDADLRRGQLRRYLGRPSDTFGLSEVLTGQNTLPEVILPGPVQGLSFIATGRYPPNPSELLMRPSLTQLLSQLNSDFDLVIVDSPPVLAVTDAVVIARQTGVTVLLVRQGKTMTAEIDAVRDTIEAAGTSISGAILYDYRPQTGLGESAYAIAYNRRYAYHREQS